MNDKNTPWQVQSSNQKYKNPWIEVVEDSVVDDRGRKLTYGVVKIIKGVCVLPLDNEGYVYLAKQFRYGLGEYSTEGPGGAIDTGETPLDAAKRELEEELGIVPSKWMDLGYVNPLTGVIHHTEYIFLATDFTPPSKIPDPSEENIELIRIPLKEAVQLVMDSKITHAPSCTLILKADHYLQSRSN